MGQFSRSPARVQIGLPPYLQSELDPLLHSADIGFVRADLTAEVVRNASGLDRSAPLLLGLDGACLAGTDIEAREALAALAGHVPIITILDRNGVDAASALLDIEGVQFLAKPFDAEDLLSVVEFAEKMHGPNGWGEAREDNAAKIALLSDEVGRIARQLASLAGHAHAKLPDGGARQAPGELARSIRDLIRRRRARAQFFPADLFADPAWDIMLDLTAARLEGQKVSISSLCIAADVPTTTALRWIKGMTDAGLLVRRDDPDDRRRSFIDLSDDAAEAMLNYFSIMDGDVI
jgi:FixJ family two-component response regulator